MINADMRWYDYFTLDGDNGYGQPQLSEEVTGSVKMAINLSSQSIQDHILYEDAAYIGLTLAQLDDTCVIQYGNEKLKVLYVNPKGRYKLVYMKRM